MADELSWLEQRLETTTDNEFFWQSGHRGELSVQSCTACDYLIHPPAPYCPKCEGDSVSPRAVSGRGTLYSYTELVHGADTDEPTIVAIVELEEQADLRLMTNLVGVKPDQVRIGMALTVAFRNEGSLSVPVFEAAS